MTIRRVGVVGCGLMGSGIAQTCAQAGYETIVREVNQQLLDSGIARSPLRRSLPTGPPRMLLFHNYFTLPCTIFDNRRLCYRDRRQQVVTDTFLAKISVIAEVFNPCLKI
jgi:glycine/D-amino acid oxidase-like deaminating enzyme